MRKQAVTPMHLDHLPLLRVVYVPQHLETVAVQCTPETIGAMAIEFGLEVETQQNYRWLSALFVRGEFTEEGKASFNVSRRITLGDWLVVLENEVHIFPSDVFQYTFGLAQEPTHQVLHEDASTPATTFMSLPAELQHQEPLPPLPE